MPNWCSTNITIRYEDSKKLKSFYDKIETWAKKKYHDNGFDYPDCETYWLGNIVGNSGLSKWDEKKDDFEPNIRCRGSINELSFDENYIHIRTETAWCPMMQMWDMLREKYLPDAEIWFDAEECGCGLYVTNDPTIAGTYYIDVWEPPEELEDIYSLYEVGEEEVVKFLQKVLKTDESDFEKLQKMSEEKFDKDDRWFSINQWQKCEISECE